MTTWYPKHRYSAVALMSQDLEHVVLIHKQKPAWQAGKANFPGGKVEKADQPPEYDPYRKDPGEYLNCARREMLEETGLDIPASALQLFCNLRFKTPEGETGECCFFVAVGDVFDAKTFEAEQIFVGDVADVLTGQALFQYWSNQPNVWLPTMPNLPYLVAMARQCLRGEGAGSWPLTIYEGSAAQC